MARDWEGREVPDPNPDDIITVWEVDPHIGTNDYDTLIERSWQAMLEYVGGSLECWLERYTLEELREGVTLKFRLRDIRADELPEEVNDSSP